jgi:hypothetical protein
MGVQGLGLEFRMELTTQKPGMIIKFDYFHQFTIGGGATDDKAVFN